MPAVHAFLILLLLGLIVPLFVSFVYNGAELGLKLELTFERIENGGHCHNLLTIWGLGSPESLHLEPVILALGGGHEGLMGDGCAHAIKVILMLMAEVRLEVVAGANKVSLKEDANEVVNGCPPHRRCTHFCR
jgi:hypothetical protein